MRSPPQVALEGFLCFTAIAPGTLVLGVVQAVSPVLLTDLLGYIMAGWIVLGAVLYRLTSLVGQGWLGLLLPQVTVTVSSTLAVLDCNQFERTQLGGEMQWIHPVSQAQSSCTGVIATDQRAFAIHPMLQMLLTLPAVVSLAAQWCRTSLQYALTYSFIVHAGCSPLHVAEQEVQAHGLHQQEHCQQALKCNRGFSLKRMCMSPHLAPAYSWSSNADGWSFMCFPWHQWDAR
jgi:hypothetical protein